MKKEATHLISKSTGKATYYLAGATKLGAIALEEKRQRFPEADPIFSGIISDEYHHINLAINDLYSLYVYLSEDMGSKPFDFQRFITKVETQK